MNVNIDKIGSSEWKHLEINLNPVTSEFLKVCDSGKKGWKTFFVCLINIFLMLEKCSAKWSKSYSVKIVNNNDEIIIASIYWLMCRELFNIDI